MQSLTSEQQHAVCDDQAQTADEDKVLLLSNSLTAKCEPLPPELNSQYLVVLMAHSMVTLGHAVMRPEN